MQNARIHLNIDKAISLAIRFGVAARRFATSALTPDLNYYTLFTPPPSLHIISVILHKPVLVIFTGLSLLGPYARFMSVVSRAIFVASGCAWWCVSLINTTNSELKNNLKRKLLCQFADCSESRAISKKMIPAEIILISGSTGNASGGRRSKRERFNVMSHSVIVPR